MRKSIFYAFMAGVLAFAVASCKPNEPEVKPDGPTDGPTDDPTVVIPTPSIAGEEGKFTIAFRVPAALACDPVINLFGDFQGNSTEDLNAPVAEKIVAEGFENWYKIVFESSDPSQAKGKICPQMEGAGTWNAQGSYTLIKGDAEIVDDYGTQNKVACKETALGQVVFVDVTKWAMDPCARPNEAGPATYELIIKTEFPADLDPFDLTVTATVGWATDKMEMVYDPSYTGGGLKFTGSVDECPANEMYKYVLKYKGGDWIYEKGDNRSMPYGNQAKDEVTEWDSAPWNPIPAGEGTFEVTLCAAVEAAYIAGPFTAEGEGGYWGECVGNEAYKMTLKEGTDATYEWTGAYPENFLFKVVTVNGEEQTWNPADNIVVDGEKFAFNLCE